MKKLFGTSALVMALALPVFAQEANTTAPANTAIALQSPYIEGIDRGVRASNFIGKRVYVTEQDTSVLSVDAIAQADTEWENAGEISDLIISLNGDAEAVLVDFGGFLGIGEKTVAISMANLVMVPDSNSPDDYFIVFHGNKAELEGAPAFNPDMVFEAVASDPMPSETTMTDQTMNAQSGTSMADDPALDVTAMSEADLLGKRVIGPNNEDLGEISAVAIGAEGAITAAVVDVGGFLGIGEKPVALGANELTIVRNAGGTVDHFQVSMTQDQLEALPTYVN